MNRGGSILIFKNVDQKAGEIQIIGSIEQGPATLAIIAAAALMACSEKYKSFQIRLCPEEFSGDRSIKVIGKSGKAIPLVEISAGVCLNVIFRYQFSGGEMDRLGVHIRPILQYVQGIPLTDDGFLDQLDSLCHISTPKEAFDSMCWTFQSEIDEVSNATISRLAIVGD